MSTISQKLIPPPTMVNNTHKNYVFGSLCAVMGALGTLGVIGRLSIRYYFQNLGADDYAIFPGMVGNPQRVSKTQFKSDLVALDYILCLDYHGKLALFQCRNWETVMGFFTVDELSMWLNGQIACVWLYPAMSASIRISILLFYKRIFGLVEHTNQLIWWLLGLQVVYVTAFTIAPEWMCKDFNFSITTWTTVCSFQYFKVLQTCLYTISLALDMVLFLFPVYPILRIRLKNTQRTKAIVIFGFGAAATIVAAYKLGVSVKEWVHIIPADSPFGNTKYHYTFLVNIPIMEQLSGIPSVLEPTIAIMAASLPAFRQLYRRLTARPQTERSYYFAKTGSTRFNRGDVLPASLLDSMSGSQRGGFHHLSGIEIELETQRNQPGKVL